MSAKPAPTKAVPAQHAPPDKTASAHSTPAAGRHFGSRARTADRARTQRLAAVATAVVVGVAAVAFAVLQDDRDPDGGPTTALPRATSGAGSPAAEPSAGATDAPTDAPGGGLVGGQPAVAPPPDPARAAAVQAATSPARTPADVRAALEQVLSARAAANTALLRGVLDGDLDAAATAAASVDAASDDLEAVVGTFQDAQLATQLRSAFDEQAVASRAYATALGDGDDSAADQARADLGAASRSLGSLLDQLTAGRITVFVPPEDAGQLRAYADAYEAGDTATASLVEQWLTARLGREGVALAAGLAGPA